MDNVAFSIFGFQVYWYGIFAAAGFVIGFSTASRRAPRAGIKGEVVFNLAPWLIVGAILGARILYVISYWDKEFAGRPLTNIFNMRAGLVYYGGLIGASLAGIIFCYRNKVPLWRMGDVMAPSVALGHAFGRIGCFMTGCCYGKACDLPWAVHFPKDHDTQGVGVHPTQLYESFAMLLVFLFLFWLHKHRRFSGQVILVYAVAYSIIRFAIEFVRDDPRGDILGLTTLTGLSTSQMISLVIGIAALILLIVRGRSSRVTNYENSRAPIRAGVTE